MGRALFLIATILITVGLCFWFWKDGNYTIEVPGIESVISIPFANKQNLTDSLSPVNKIAEPTVSSNLAQYSFGALKKRNYPGSEIILERKLKVEDGYISYLFSFTTDGKKVTGQANIPKSARHATQGAAVGKAGRFPVVVMVRGYVDREVYETGIGTRKAASRFAENGFITLAPDFLGFGGSDWESPDILESRFEKPITVLNLLASASSLPQADTQNLFLWGHSNGGQIILSVLEISGKAIPTALWAPVTRGFPESVTGYVGEMEDEGNMVIASIAAFTKVYDPDDFSISNYVSDINAEIQFHQGTFDPLIKTEWTTGFVEKLRGLGKSASLFTYPRDDHNLSRNWDTVVERDLVFFKKHLE